MAINTKLIKRRLKSIASTKKITKAMELVAASKMRKAVASALGARPFAVLSEELISELAQIPGLEQHRFFQPPEVKKTLLLLITPNRGLCGGLNATLFKTLTQLNKTQTFDTITIGKRGEGMIKSLGLKIIAAFGTVSDTPKWSEIYPAVKIIREEYEKNNYDQVMLIYSEFVSALAQKPRVRQILPFSLPSEKSGLQAARDPSTSSGRRLASFLFEPNRGEVLETLLPRLLETQIYQSSLEAVASEHSARMLAMRSASDAAEEMIGDLLFTFNQARQAGITQEIAEISSGAAAIASS